METGLLGSATAFNLRSVAADYWLANQHSDLVSLSHARVDLLPHQVSVVHRVVSKYPHRFMLCDEVGLGKTIEAAMVIKELRARRQAVACWSSRRPGLQRQWQFELKTKFNETLRHLQQGHPALPRAERRRESVDGSRLDHHVPQLGFVD